MEKKTSLKVPEAFLPLMEDVRLLKSDGQNPNKMTNKLKDELWHSLLEYGWTDPIITDQAGVLCDGEQRATVCKNHNEFFVPVLKLPMTEAQRRKGRLEFNEVHGKHNKLMEQEEWKRLIDLGAKDTLQTLLDAVGERLPEELSGLREGSNMVPESYEIATRFRDEAEQKRFFEKLLDPKIRDILELNPWNESRVVNL